MRKLQRISLLTITNKKMKTNDIDTITPKQNKPRIARSVWNRLNNAEKSKLFFEYFGTSLATQQLFNLNFKVAFAELEMEFVEPQTIFTV